MTHSRRSILRKASALSALAVGASVTASAADCGGAPTWDATTLYATGDQVQHPDSDGVDALWEAALDSRNAEPSRSSAYWDYVGDCDGGGGGGNEAPTASFSTDVSTPEPGEDVTFDGSGSSDPDGSIASYEWDFGDGSTATGQSVTHSYSSSGDYTVTLTVTDDGGASDSASTTVSVSSGTSNEAPNASFTVSPSSPEPGETTTFDAADSSDPDGSIASYDWEFGDGSTASGQSVTHSYASEGDYTVSLTVTDDDGASDANSTTVSVAASSGGVDCSGVSEWQSDVAYSGGDQVTYEGDLFTAEWWTQGEVPDDSKNVWTLEGTCDGGGGGGNDAPTASFTTSPSSPEPGESVSFDASGSSDPDGDSLTYDWSFGDGSSASGEIVSHTFDAEGDYTVTLTVADGNGNTDTDSTTLSVSAGGGGGAGENRIVGYWMQWAQYDREYVPADIPTDQVTHLQYAFMRPESDGTISGLGDSYAQRYLFPESWHDVTTFEDISNDNDVTVLISIGGWSDSENFSDAALTESTRQTFADECVRIVREAGVDGVDIDWEYPGGGGHPDNTVRDGDQERFTQLIQACRDALDAAGAEDGRDYHLSTAMSADPSTVAGLDHATLSDLLDFTSVMTFDYRGGFSDYTGHNSPLFENPADPSDQSAEWNVQAALQYYVDQGWDPGQLNMATPFYGRSWTGVEPPSGDLGNGVDDGLFQVFGGTGEGSFPPDTSESGIYDYWDLSTVGTARSTSQVDLSTAAWETMFDDTAETSYSYNQSDGMMISHPTPDSVNNRAAWLANSDYGGTMIWALSHDTVEHHLLDELSAQLL